VPSSIAAECLALEERVFSVKTRFLGMYHRAHAGHIGSSLSCAELLVFLKFGWMADDDRLVLSKGHAAAALYATWAEAGLLDDAQLATFYADGTQLPALPPFKAFPEIPFATGSLGHGLSVSAGMALGARLKGSGRRCFCVTSDGELDEGSVWEAALFISHHRLTNLLWVIDRNQLQGIGRTEDVLALEPLARKLEAFGFRVFDLDGHDLRALLAARDQATREATVAGARPVVIIANTFKGHGLAYMQDTVDSHYLPMTDAQFAGAIADITAAHQGAMARYRDAD